MTWPRVSGEQIVATAREYIGTPWVHCGRVKGVGIDCSGLIDCVLGELGVKTGAPTAYPLDGDFDAMIDGFRRVCRELRDDEPLNEGDFLVFRNNLVGVRVPMTNHCGIYTGPGDDTVIHAWGSPRSGRKTVETPMDAFWRRCTVGRFRYRGAE